MIEVRDLRFDYGEGEFRLEVPVLQLERGRIAACIGPSGSGKTTLLNLIAGIFVPQAGQVVTNGVDVTALSDEERRSFRITNIGLVFQEFELLEYLSVLDNILLPYRINRALQLDASVRQRAERLARLLAIEERLAGLFAGRADEPVLGSHPVYQYFACRYNLNLRSVRFEPDEMPDAGAWRELEALLSEHPARWMIWEGAPSEEIAARLKVMGVESVVFDPCANVPVGGDYLSVMRANVRNVETTLGAS